MTMRKRSMFLLGFAIGMIAYADRFLSLIASCTLAALFSLTQSAPSGFRSQVACYAVTPNSIDVGLKKEAILDTFMEEFAMALLPVNAFATDFSDAIVDEGDKVKVGYVPLADAAKDFAGTYITQASSYAKKEVQINKHKYVSWGLSDGDIFSGSLNALKTQARQKAHALAKSVLQDMLSLVTAEKFGAAIFTGAASSFDLDDVADIRTAVAQAYWPAAGRSLVLNAGHYGAVVKTDSMQNANQAGGTEVRTTGKLPMLYTFQPYETECIPGNGEHLVGFANLPSAIAVAMRYLQPRRPEKYIEARALKDPATGITIGFRHDYDTTTGVESHIFECNYGYDALETSALKRIVSE